MFNLIPFPIFELCRVFGSTIWLFHTFVKFIQGRGQRCCGMGIVVYTKHIGAETMWPPFRRRYIQCIFFNENVWIPIEISLTFVPKGAINNTPSLVQTMAWCRPGDNPLSEPMLVRLPTYICVNRPQWVKVSNQTQKRLCFLGVEPYCRCFDALRRIRPLVAMGDRGFTTICPIHLLASIGRMNQ